MEWDVCHYNDFLSVDSACLIGRGEIDCACQVKRKQCYGCAIAPTGGVIAFSRTNMEGIADPGGLPRQQQKTEVFESKHFRP